jgi:hypothetical protein
MPDVPEPDPDVAALAARLQQLEDEIREVRADFERHQEGRQDGQRWYESGDIRPDLDDQTIVPPG